MKTKSLKLNDEKVLKGRVLQTVTFTTACKQMQFTVLEKFTKYCRDYDKLGLYELSSQHQIGSYLHNHEGPAYVNKVNGVQYYFLEGRQLSEIEFQHMRSYHEFGNAVEKILEEDDE